MKAEIIEIIQRTCRDLFGVRPDIILSRPEEQFGDLATNVALQLAKQVGKSPRDIAAALVSELQHELTNYASQVTVAGPGFINVRLRDEVLYKAATESLEHPPMHYDGRTVLIETNNPNPFKDLHIGHAYNSIVADTIANLLEAGQADTHRVSYHGDVGLHVGKSVWAIRRYCDQNNGNLLDIPEADRPTFMSRMYAEGSTAYEQDDAAKQQIEQYAKQSFELSDPWFKTTYEQCRNWSFEYFDKVFASIGSKPIERRYFEHETDTAGREVVEGHIGPVFEYSDGAVVFKAEQFGLHTRVFIGSRGTTLYEARDLGLIRLKDTEFQPDLSIIVTGNEQKEYFKVVLKAAELAMPEAHGITRNIPTGIVKLATGKMSSRSGDVINIGWLFTEIEQALRARGAADATIDDGIIGALRYTMLRVRVGNDVIFDINEAISLEGNSGPYLQYAHARACSILSKGKTDASVPEDLLPGERTLLRKLDEYADVLQKSVEELMPHHICTYLYELAQEFNRFYEHNRVIGDDREMVRLQLVGAYQAILSHGLRVLGIPAPEKI